LQDHASFTFLELRPFFAKSGHLPKKLFVLLAPFKVALNALLLLWILFLARPSRFIMVQNPPFIPTLPVVKLWCLLSGSKLVIDWHNTGSSILAMRLGEQSPMVKLSDMYSLTLRAARSKIGTGSRVYWADPRICTCS
jgi:beta-1,4-mannosyltransferase